MLQHLCNAFNTVAAYSAAHTHPGITILQVSKTLQYRFHFSEAEENSRW